jgi:hypothetical protein
VLFNGVPMSKNDDGRIDFSNWGGLNDVTRYPQENVDNLNPSEYTFVIRRCSIITQELLHRKEFLSIFSYQ